MLGQQESYYINEEVSEFIPVTCHYDPYTLLTKDGDLIQILEVSGFATKSSAPHPKSLREALRSSILKHIKAPNYAIYIHTISNPRNLMQSPSFASKFALEVEEAWGRLHHWDQQLVGALYISIVAQGFRPAFLDFRIMLQGLFFPLARRNYLKGLELKNQALSKIMKDIAADLSGFSSKRLGVVKAGDRYISEPLSFYYNLIHLKRKEIALGYHDASQQLSDVEINYLFNTLEVMEGVGEQNTPTLAAVYTLKAPYDLGDAICNQLLKFECKYIITEAMLFVPAALALKGVQRQQKIIQASRADELSSLNGINNVVKHDQKNSTDFCERQITITIYHEDPQKFAVEINLFIKAAHELGLVIVREDFSGAKCFWSQLPGNFPYITRKQYNATAYVGLFSSLVSDDSSGYSGSKWGSPVTFFKTLQDTPYYFNFHTGDNGNTIIMGSQHSGKTTLMKFILAQATRNNPKIISISLKAINKEFFTKLGGHTIDVGAEGASGQLQLDIFNLASFGGDPQLFKEFMLDILLAGLESEMQHVQNLSNTVDLMLAANSSAEKLTLLEGFVKGSEDPLLIARLEEFYQDFYKVFGQTDSVEALKQHHIVNIDFSASSLQAPRKRVLCHHFVSLILIKLLELLDGTPTIICLDDFHLLSKNRLMGLQAKKWLQQLAKKNALAFFTADYNESLYTSPVFQEAFSLFVTKIFLSSRFADNVLKKKSLSLTDKDLHTIKSYDISKYNMLVKQGGTTTVITFKFGNLTSLLAA